MADGKWVMSEDDAKRVDITFSGSGRQNMRELPNYGQHRPDIAGYKDGVLKGKVSASTSARYMTQHCA